eukprot:GHRR01008338.1.p1 GENE.GHRR01008338.1~~GHRR01008338.1.p1  ORF type:complete len:1287 (+),score=597.52 GHRR01008338.1:548-4408(+)
MDSNSSYSSSFGNSSRNGINSNGTAAKGKRARAAERAALAAMVHSAPGESVEWVNMCFRKIWRVYQRGLERWITDLLQPVFDGLVQAGSLPTWLLRLRIVELTLDHEAPYFSNMRRRNSRKDSDLTGVVDLRYTGGVRLLLMLELGQGRWRFKIPVLVSDLDVQCALWLKLRLAPMCPWVGTISLAFVGPPAVKVQLSPYNRVRLMRIPVIQNLLNRLLTVDLPALMVLPERLEISVPPSVTSIAEAAVGRDTIMRAVASAVLQVDSLEQALLAALPLGPQAAAGGVSLPELFRGELTVLLRGGRNLPVWGLPWQSNPWVRLVLGEQAVASRRDSETSTASRHGAPVWNQEVQFLVEDPDKQVLEVYVNDSHLTGRPKVGKAILQLRGLPPDGKLSVWLPLQPVNPGQKPMGEVLLDVTFKAFEDDEQDSGYREAQEYARAMQKQSEAITDIRSAAAASSRAAVAASAAISAIAMTKAAAARAAARAAQAAQAAGAAALSSVSGQPSPEQQQQIDAAAAVHKSEQPVRLLPPANGTSATAGAAQPYAGADAGASGGQNGNAAEEEAEAAAAAAKRREEALVQALEARMAFRVRSTHKGGSGRSLGSADSANAGPLSSLDSAVLAAAAANGASPAARNGAKAGARDASGGVAGSSNRARVGVGSSGNGASATSAADILDITATLPADSLSDSSEEDEAVAVERAQIAAANILEKSRRVEEALAELAAVSAGSPTEKALQQALSSMDALVPATTAAAAAAGAAARAARNSSGGSSAAARAAAAPAGVSVAEHGHHHVANGGNSNFGRHGGSHGSTAGSSRFESREELAAQKQQQQQVDGSEPPPYQVLGKAADFSISGGSLGLSDNERSVTAHNQQQQQHIPSMVVKVTDGGHIKAQVVGGGQDTAAQTAEVLYKPSLKIQPSSAAAEGNELNPAVIASLTDELPADAVTRVAAQAAAGPAAEADAVNGQLQQQVEQQQQLAAAEEPQPWWAPVIFWLPGQKDGIARSKPTAATAAPVAKPSSSSSSKRSKRSKQSIKGSSKPESPEPDATLLAPELISTAQRAWWQPLLDNDFIKLLPGMHKDKEASSSSSSSGKEGKGSKAAATIDSSQQQGEGAESEQSTEEEKPWWASVTDLSWLPKFGDSSSSSDDGDSSSGAAGANGSKPVGAIIIPPDLPLEDIAREVARLKEDAWRSKEDHVESLWAKTVERNDRSWLMLFCFLLAVAVGLLAVVVYRLGGLQGNVAADAVTAAVQGAAEGAGDGVSPGVQLPLLLLSLAAYISYWGIGI